jgi:hypothetical protein
VGFHLPTRRFLFFSAMPATLTIDQLKAALTADQIAAAQSEGLEPQDNVDPVAEEIGAAIARVDAYCAGYLPAAALLTGWARDLAAWHVAKRLTLPTEAQTSARDRALKELEDLRDGKFPQIPRDTAATATQGKVEFGGKTKIL